MNFEQQVIIILIPFLFISIYLAYLWGLNENTTEEILKSIWAWCNNKNNFNICRGDCALYDTKCFGTIVDLNGIIIPKCDTNE